MENNGHGFKQLRPYADEPADEPDKRLYIWVEHRHVYKRKSLDIVLIIKQAGHELRNGKFNGPACPWFCGIRMGRRCFDPSTPFPDKQNVYHNGQWIEGYVGKQLLDRPQGESKLAKLIR